MWPERKDVMRDIKRQAWNPGDWMWGVVKKEKPEKTLNIQT